MFFKTGNMSIQNFISDLFLVAVNGCITYQQFDEVVVDSQDNDEFQYIKDLNDDEINDLKATLARYKLTLVENDIDVIHADYDDSDNNYDAYIANDDKIREFHEQNEGEYISPFQLYTKDMSSLTLLSSKSEEQKLAFKIRDNSVLLFHGLMACPINMKHILSLYDNVLKEYKEEKAMKEKSSREMAEAKIRLERFAEHYLSDETQGNMDKEELSQISRDKILESLEWLKKDYAILMNLYKNRKENWQEEFNLKRVQIIHYFQKVVLNTSVINQMYENMRYYRKRIRDTEEEFLSIFKQENLPIEKWYHFCNQNYIDTNYFLTWEQEKDQYENLLHHYQETFSRLIKRLQDIQNELGGVLPLHFKSIYAKQIDLGFKSMTQYKQLMVKCNLRLVIRVAQRYRNLANQEDLIQEGNIGLMKAVDKFDPNLGFKFSTYATWWIKQGITRYLAVLLREIRLPVHLIEYSKKIRQYIKEYEQEHHKEPNEIWIAQKMGLPVKKVVDLMNISQQPHSLENDVSDDGETKYMDLLEDTHFGTPEDNLIKKRMADVVAKVLDEVLTEKEKKVIQMRFGLGLEKDYTLEEIGKYLNVTRERVRQIESKAIKKLEQTGHINGLRDFFESSSQKKCPPKLKRGRKPKNPPKEPEYSIM